MFMDGVSNPEETFGRPDTPNPGTLWACQPYNNSIGATVVGMVSWNRIHARPYTVAAYPWHLAVGPDYRGLPCWRRYGCPCLT